MSPRRVCVVTGTRAEYGLLRPIVKAIEATAQLELLVIATGMHLAPTYGHTVREIRNDGFTVHAEVDMLMAGNSKGSMSRSVGMGIIGLTQAFEALRPDLVLVLGDRSEPLAAAIAAAHLGIPVAHLHGGETTLGAIDESSRHAITRFAHVHFAATPGAAARLHQMGEEPWRIHQVGAPGLDSILNREFPNRATLCHTIGLDPEVPIILVVQHPETVGNHDTRAQMKETLAAATSVEGQVVAIYPNSDAASEGIVAAISEEESAGRIKGFRNLLHDQYLALLHHCAVMVGNSSSGILEAPSFGLPFVNVGNRQAGRERGGNVIDAPYERTVIAAAIHRALTDTEFRSQVARRQNPYGDGRCSERVVQVLRSVSLDNRLLTKQLVFPS